MDVAPVDIVPSPSSVRAEGGELYENRAETVSCTRMTVTRARHLFSIPLDNLIRNEVADTKFVDNAPVDFIRDRKLIGLAPPERRITLAEPEPGKLVPMVLLLIKIESRVVRNVKVPHMLRTVTAAEPTCKPILIFNRMVVAEIQPPAAADEPPKLFLFVANTEPQSPPERVTLMELVMPPF